MEGHIRMYTYTQLGFKIKLNVCGDVFICFHILEALPIQSYFLAQSTAFQSTWIRLLILQHSGWSIDLEISNLKGSTVYQLSEVWDIPHGRSKFSSSKQCHCCYIYFFFGRCLKNIQLISPIIFQAEIARNGIILNASGILRWWRCEFSVNEQVLISRILSNLQTWILGSSSSADSFFYNTDGFQIKSIEN